ncbi:MAG TPA: PspC domain-containing protein [Ignavibacteriales bacterium]|nr:PspC domain-containing protein [Ignavibacteriales bacterium]HOL81123.1 PspC domain-containing protein [Ignavibacteriales bacterium]HOM65226.1 PspC domain-containing protein [Ignavibacteriales bacterium]HPD66518.1 PspC domain-containing protein [Ignavibacteriales bacterium]HPP33521.1 PspC domain-containing protein [Ignavibacteriales bacterium]
MKKLYRSSSNKKIAGVCGGLAEYFNFDVNLLRIIFFVGAFFYGFFIILYIAMWFVLPYDNEISN